MAFNQTTQCRQLPETLINTNSRHILASKVLGFTTLCFLIHLVWYISRAEIVLVSAELWNVCCGKRTGNIFSGWKLYGKDTST